jgi:hypothetical protein
VETPRPRNRMLRGKEDERADARRNRSRQEENADEPACGRRGEEGERLETGGLTEAVRNDESPRGCDENEYRENVENSSDRKVPPDKGSLTKTAQGEREKSEPNTSWAEVQGTCKKASAPALGRTCFHLRSGFYSIGTSLCVNSHRNSSPGAVPFRSGWRAVELSRGSPS